MKKISKIEFKDRIDQTFTWIDLLMRNKTVIAIMLLIDGITFVISPNTGVNGLARGVAFTVIIAAVTILFSAMFEEKKTKKTAFTICSSIFAILLSIAVYIWPKIPAAILTYLLALIIIYSCSSNVFQTLRLEKLILRQKKAAAKFNRIDHGLSEILPKDEIRQSIKDGIDEQISKRLDPMNELKSKFSLHSKIEIIIDLVGLIFGILILFLPGLFGRELMRICGVAMFIAAADNLWITIHAYLNKRKVIVLMLLQRQENVR